MLPFYRYTIINIFCKVNEVRGERCFVIKELYNLESNQMDASGSVYI